MPPISYAQLLRQNRNFRLLWAGQVVSQLGDWFSLITLQSQLLTITGSASSLAGLLVAGPLALVRDGATGPALIPVLGATSRVLLFTGVALAAGLALG